MKINILNYIVLLFFAVGGVHYVYKTVDEDKRYVATIGMVVGMAFIPVCWILGGLIGGIPLAIIIANTIPILIVVIIMMLLVYFVPTIAVAVFDVVSKAVLFINTQQLLLFLRLQPVFSQQ